MRVFLTKLLFFNTALIAQTHNCKIYTDLTQLKFTDPDSVFCLELKSKKLDHFPSEICHYRNLKYLSLSSILITDPILYDSLCKKQKRQLKKQIRLEREFGIEPPAYHSNTITALPRCFYELEKLETLFISNITFNITLYDSLNKYLPNLIIEPPKLVLLHENSVERRIKKKYGNIGFCIGEKFETKDVRKRRNDIVVNIGIHEMKPQGNLFTYALQIPNAVTWNFPFASSHGFL